MSWSDVLNLLLQVLAAELPDAVAFIIDWIKRWLDARLPSMETLEEIPTGSLEEFKLAVRKRIAEFSQRLPVFIRRLFASVMMRLSDQILERVYKIVVGQEPAPVRAMSCPDELAAILDAAAVEEPA